MKVKHIKKHDHEGRSELTFRDERGGFAPYIEELYGDCEVEFDKEKIIIKGWEVACCDFFGWAFDSFEVTDEIREEYILDETKIFEKVSRWRKKPTGKFISTQRWCEERKRKPVTLYINNYIITDKRKSENV